MNYLGHAYLSFNNPENLIGNMIGDQVKGLEAIKNYPENIQKGILLHRKIDEYTDNHPITKQNKLLFSKEYGLYSGAIVDIIYDYFLANDYTLFRNEQELFNFSQQVYKYLDNYISIMPIDFLRLYTYMKQHNWLYNYRTIKGIEKSLNGLHRMANGITPMTTAIGIFISNHNQLNQQFSDFIIDIINFVKIESKISI